MSAGWFDDPSGRFGRRWFDGATWTEHVVGANGTATTDALPASDVPFPPPADAARPEPTVPHQAPPQQFPPQQFPPQGFPAPPVPSQQFPPPWAPRVGERLSPGIGLVVGLVGVAVVALSLFVLKWVDADKGTFVDFGEGARNANTDGADLGPTLAITYVAWAGFVLLAVTAAAVLAAGLPIPPTSDKAQRIVGSVVAGAAAVLHAVTFSQLGRTTDLQFGAYLGTAGYFVVIVGFVLGARRAAPARPPFAPGAVSPPPQRSPST